jgi:hypothetical protein
VGDLSEASELCRVDFGMFKDGGVIQCGNKIDFCQEMYRVDKEGSKPQCKTCNENFKPVNENSVCEAVKIDNCPQINLQQGKCSECALGYILNTNSLLCIEQTSLPGCREASEDGSQCNECYANQGMQREENKQVCRDIAISHCKLAKIKSQFDEFQVCEICQPEFYLANNRRECKEGGVANCEINTENQPNRCDQCKNNYLRITGNNNQHYCRPLQEHISCEQFNVESYQHDQGATISCSSCIEEQELVAVPVLE